MDSLKPYHNMKMGREEHLQNLLQPPNSCSKLIDDLKPDKMQPRSLKPWRNEEVMTVGCEIGLKEREGVSKSLRGALQVDAMKSCHTRGRSMHDKHTMDTQ